ncbi:hypothetical protein [Mycobacterium sp.]|uniref:hypothetical protein n=1 Tax=Mycobacterium sp. TaxID=1785 RepID=UPI003D0B2E88
MIKGWQATSSTIVVAVLTSALITGDLTDEAFRRWWSSRALTTDIVGGILVVLVTVLVVDQLVRFRRQRDQSRATATQAAIVLSQAIRVTRLTSELGDNSGDRAAASEEGRIYTIMLLVAAPILIEAKIPRAFLEQAQKLGAQLTQRLTPATYTFHLAMQSNTDLEETLNQVKIAAAPLIALLTAAERTAAGGEDIE